MQKHDKANNSTDRTFTRSPNLFCVHDRAHSNSQSHGGHFWEISIEEASVGHDSVLCESLHPGSRHQARPRLIKGNVAIRSNTWHDSEILVLLVFLHCTITNTTDYSTFSTSTALLWPPTNSWIPPADFISPSKASHSAWRSAAFPSRMWVFSARMSMCLKKLFHMKEW